MCSSWLPPDERDQPDQCEDGHRRCDKRSPRSEVKAEEKHQPRDERSALDPAVILLLGHGSGGLRCARSLLLGARRAC